MLLINGNRLGEGLVELVDRGAVRSPNCVGYGNVFYREPSVPGFPNGGRSYGPPAPDCVAPRAATLLRPA
jgi:hypothetical protein